MLEYQTKTTAAVRKAVLSDPWPVPNEPRLQVNKTTSLPRCTTGVGMWTSEVIRQKREG